MMQIRFANKKLMNMFTSETECRKQFGADNAKKVLMRLNTLAAANSLADIPLGLPPERLHELTGDKAGIFSVDIKQPYRLLFRPIDAADPRPEKVREYLESIKIIEIVGVEDTHG